MGTTEDQANQKKTATVEVEKEESTVVDSSTVSAETTESNLEGQNQTGTTADASEPVPEEVKATPVVETMYLDDSKVGVRFDNYPLSVGVVQALRDNGHQYLSRYQQAIFDSLTIGADRWFSINLASNRGLIIGTYLVDLAQTDLSKTTVVLCVAVPKIRSYFERDLMSIAKYTGVKIMSVGSEVPEDVQLTEKPNIVIASIEMVVRLQEQLELSEVEVVYFDEVEKTIRDAEDAFVNFVNGHAFPQVVLQSSYYSESLIEAVHRCKPDLDPTRLFKHHSNFPALYTARLAENLEMTDLSWQGMLEAVLPKVLLSRIVVLTSEGAQAAQWLRTRGWDVTDTTSLSSIGTSTVDDLRENRVQLVLTTKQLFLAANNLEFDVLIAMDALTEDDAGILKKNRRVAAVVLFDHPEVTYCGNEVLPLSKFKGEFKRSESVVHSLRQNGLQGLNTDWTGLVDDILEEVDGRQLLGEALRLALQSKRARQGYIRSSVYKLENKDVFQRRNRKRSR